MKHEKKKEKEKKKRNEKKRKRKKRKHTYNIRKYTYLDAALVVINPAPSLVHVVGGLSAASVQAAARDDSLGKIGVLPFGARLPSGRSDRKNSGIYARICTLNYTSAGRPTMEA
jgi:hypothetical protein